MVHNEKSIYDRQRLKKAGAWRSLKQKSVGCVSEQQPHLTSTCLRSCVAVIVEMLWLGFA